jgi:CHAT domain-containing protein
VEILKRRNVIKALKKYLKVFFLLILSYQSNTYAQKETDLETKTYTAIDSFVAKQSQQSIRILEKAESNFNQSPFTKTKNQELAITILLCNKAYFLNKFGQTQKAIFCYEKARKNEQKFRFKNFDIVENCLIPLGNLYTILNDFSNAENTIKEYFAIAEKQKNSTVKNIGILNLSNVYQSQGKQKEAIFLLETSIQNNKLSNIEKGAFYNNLGANYILLKQFEKAEITIQKAIFCLKNQTSQNQKLANAYRNLTSIYIENQNFEKANLCFEKAKQYLLYNKTSFREEIKFQIEEAILLLSQQKNQKANVILNKALQKLIPSFDPKTTTFPASKSLYAEPLLLEIIDQKARVFQQQNNLKKTIESITLGLNLEQILAESNFSENTKIINQTRVHGKIENGLNAFFELYKTQKKQTIVEAAFSLCENNKANVLKNYLQNKKNTTEIEKKENATFISLSIKIINEQEKGSLANVDSINQYIQEQNILVLKLKEKATVKAFNFENKIDFKTLLSNVEASKSELKFYFYGQENGYVFSIKNRKIGFEKIENYLLFKENLSQYLAFFKNPDAISNHISNYQKLGNNLLNSLKIQTNTKFENLLIVPDGLLGFLPFETLITKPENTSNFSKMHYLFQKTNIVYNQNASTFFDATAAFRKKSVLGIFPIFKNTNLELSFSKQEKNSISKYFSGLFFENKDATFENFKKNAPKFDILHLSTHAASGDDLMPASIQFFDRKVFYSELYNLDIDSKLIVLSACETGIGINYSGEGSLSVGRGFQAAGAKNILLSLWKVNDYTTSVFMDDFYRNLSENETFHEANKLAKQNFLDNKDIPNAKKSPYFWAAFVFCGVQTTSSDSCIQPLLFGLFFTLILFFIFIKKRDIFVK